MTRRVGDILIIEPEERRICDRCAPSHPYAPLRVFPGVRCSLGSGTSQGRKKLAETRDVLGNGSHICFRCTTKTELEAYEVRLFGES